MSGAELASNGLLRVEAVLALSSARAGCCVGSQAAAGPCQGRRAQTGVHLPMPCHAASLKPAQYAQCVNPSNGKGGQPLDTTNMQGGEQRKPQVYALGCGFGFAALAL